MKWRKFTHFVAEHSSKIEFILMIILLLAAGISWWIDSYSILISSFSLLGIEVFLMHYTLGKQVDRVYDSHETLRFITNNDMDIRDLIHSAKSDVYIFGHTLTTVGFIKEEIIDAINRGVTVYLLFGVTKKNVNVYQDIRGGDATAQSRVTHLISAYTTIEEIRKRIEVKTRFLVRYAPAVLANTYMGKDIKSINGLLQLDLLVWNVSSQKRPHLLITKSLNPKWFEVYQGYMMDLWNESKQVDCINLLDKINE